MAPSSGTDDAGRRGSHPDGRDRPEHDSHLRPDGDLHGHRHQHLLHRRAPTGSVEFFDGSNDIGPATLVSSSASSATFTFSTATLWAGTHTIYADYTPSGLFQQSHGSLTNQVINQRPITVTAAPNTKPYDGTKSAAATPTITSGSLVSGDTPDFTESYTTVNVGTGLTLVPARHGRRRQRRQQLCRQVRHSTDRHDHAVCLHLPDRQRLARLRDDGQLRNRPGYHHQHRRQQRDARHHLQQHGQHDHDPRRHLFHHRNAVRRHRPAEQLQGDPEERHAERHRPWPGRSSSSTRRPAGP